MEKYLNEAIIGNDNILELIQVKGSYKDYIIQVEA